MHFGRNIQFSVLFFAGIACHQQPSASSTPSAATTGGSSSACIPTRFAAIPAEGGQNIMATIGTATYRLECLSTLGTNATIYKIRGDSNPQYIYKIAHPTENGEQNLELELALLTKLRNTALQQYLVESYPVTYSIRCRTFHGFKKRFVKGPTLRELGPLNPHSSEHQLVKAHLMQLYTVLKQTIESGHLISDIHDDNIIWDTVNKKLVIIDGHYDIDSRTNFSQYFREQCENSWPWCKSLVKDLKK